MPATRSDPAIESLTCSGHGGDGLQEGPAEVPRESQGAAAGVPESKGGQQSLWCGTTDLPLFKELHAIFG